MYNGENNIYQLEFARFRTGSTGIIEFKDTRKFLSFTGIYAQIKTDCEKVMAEIKQELANVKDGSDYLLKSTGGTVKGKTIFEGGIEGNVKGNVTGNCSGSSGSCTGNASTATTANSAKGCTRK